MDGYKWIRLSFWFGYVKNIKRGILINGIVLIDVLFCIMRCMEIIEIN